MTERMEDIARNLRFWNAFKKTPDVYDGMVVKEEFRRRRFQGTAIRPMYIIARLTETFGPAGLGWGVDVEHEQIVRVDDDTQLHVIRIRLWYVDPATGAKGSIVGIGQTILREVTDRGAWVNEEAPKQSLTDALAKAASWLGIGADVHSGLSDSKWTAPHPANGTDAQRPGRAASVSGFPDLGALPNDRARFDAVMRWLETARRGDVEPMRPKLLQLHRDLHKAKLADLAGSLAEAVNAAMGR